MAKRQLNLLTNNEVVNDEETTIMETTEVLVETTVTETEDVVEKTIEVVTEVVDETAEVAMEIDEEVKSEELVVEENKNNILTKHIYDIKPGVYTIILQLNDTGELVHPELNIRPSEQNKHFLVSDYITYYYTSKLKYKNFTIVSIK